MSKSFKNCNINWPHICYIWKRYFSQRKKNNLTGSICNFFHLLPFVSIFFLLGVTGNNVLLNRFWIYIMSSNSVYLKHFVQKWNTFVVFDTYFYLLDKFFFTFRYLFTFWILVCLFIAYLHFFAACIHWTVYKSRRCWIRIVLVLKQLQMLHLKWILIEHDPIQDQNDLYCHFKPPPL